MSARNGIVLDPRLSPRYPRRMHRLIECLRRDLTLDFQGEWTLAEARQLLAGDDSRAAKKLLAKLNADGVDAMMLALADRFLERARQALTDEVMREELRTYAER